MSEYENDIRSEAVQNFIKQHGLELKKLNALGGPIHESVAFNAELHKDGKLIGSVRDDGNGGGAYIWPDCKPMLESIESALEEAAIVWYMTEFGEKGKDERVLLPSNWDLESLVTEMAMLLLEEKEWKAKTRTKVFVQTTDCGPDEWYHYKRQAKVSDKVRNGRFEMFLMEYIIGHFGRENIKEVRGLRTLEWESFRVAGGAA